jgi:hypothetical protein
MTASDGSPCIDDLTGSLSTMDANLGAPNATGTADEWGLLLQDATANLTPTPGQTFIQWVEANATIITVTCAVVGGLVALTRIGKR